MRLESAPIVDLVALSYDMTSDHARWTKRVLESLMSIADAKGAAFFRFETGYEDGKFQVRGKGDLLRAGRGSVWNDATYRAVLQGPNNEEAFGRTLAGTVSEVTKRGTEIPHLPGWRNCWKEPIVDSLGLVSRDADGSGFMACVGLEQTEQTTLKQKKLLTKLVTHLAAGDRLRRAHHSRPLDDAEAILTPNGNLLHAAEAAKNKRSSIDDGRRRRDQANKTKHDAEKALDIWKGLVAGRWSLVDHFDTDGKRFLLAMKNTPEVGGRSDLTPRERRVCALAAMGHRDKEIAYTLGLSLGSVTTSLRRARIKLKASSRIALAAAWRRGEG